MIGSAQAFSSVFTGKRFDKSKVNFSRCCHKISSTQGAGISELQPPRDRSTEVRVSGVW